MSLLLSSFVLEHLLYLPYLLKHLIFFHLSVFPFFYLGLSPFFHLLQLNSKNFFFQTSVSILPFMIFYGYLIDITRRNLVFSRLLSQIGLSEVIYHFFSSLTCWLFEITRGICVFFGHNVIFAVSKKLTSDIKPMLVILLLFRSKIFRFSWLFWRAFVQFIEFDYTLFW